MLKSILCVDSILLLAHNGCTYDEVICRGIRYNKLSSKREIQLRLIRHGGRLC